MQLDSLAVVDGLVYCKYLGVVLVGVHAGVRCVLACVVQAGVVQGASWPTSACVWVSGLG